MSGYSDETNGRHVVFEVQGILCHGRFAPRTLLESVRAALEDNRATAGRRHAI